MFFPDETVDKNKYDRFMVEGKFIHPIDGEWKEKEHTLVVSPQLLIKALLKYIGDDPEREGLLETPDRVIRSFEELYSGYTQDPEDVLKFFEDGVREYDEIVLLKDIEFISMCEHHMLPFYGVAHIGYIPDGRVIGLSKLARLMEVFSRRLQVQEKLTTQITTSLMTHLKPKGAACIIEAKHLCMCARGVLKQNSKMVTSSMIGVFRDKPEARQELLALIGG